MAVVIYQYAQPEPGWAGDHRGCPGASGAGPVW